MSYSFKNELKGAASMVLMGLVLASCASSVKPAESNSEAPDSSIQAHEEVPKEFIPEGSFTLIDFPLEQLTQEQFYNYVIHYNKTFLNECSFSQLHLTEESYCDQICETYLLENDSPTRFYLPSDYDAGILGASFSPDCSRLIVCSSYDGPDYENYYEYRAACYVYEIKGTDGFNSLKPSLAYTTKKWSIEDFTWINNSELGLMLYTEPRFGDGSQVNYSYFKTALPQ